MEIKLTNNLLVIKKTTNYKKILSFFYIISTHEFS